MHTKKRILLVVHTNSYFTGLLPLAQVLHRSLGFEPLFLFVRYYPTLPGDLEVCQTERILVLLEENVDKMLHGTQSEHRGQLQGVQDLRSRLKRYYRYLRSPAYLVNTLLSRFFRGRLLDEIIKLARTIRSVRKVIRKHDISLLVLPADNRYDQAAYVKAAHREQIAAVVIPQFMANHREWAEYVWDQKPYQMGGFYNKLVKILYPRWVLDYKDRQFVALPGVQILAREWHAIAPPLPWILHSGHADALALESEAVHQYCLEEGLPPEKLIVTGSASLDAMFNTMANNQHKKGALRQSLGIHDGQPVILSALPPDSIYMGRPECDFQKYGDLVEFWCKAVSSIPGYQHVVALHPSVKYEDMRHIEEWGLRIARVPTMEVVPLCDIFVAAASSTIQWAIAYAKPVLNYDVYRYRYTDYKNAGGVLTTEEKEEFLRLLKRLTANIDFYEQTKSAQAECAEQWGRLDGKATERLQNLFRSLMAAYARETQAT